MDKLWPKMLNVAILKISKLPWSNNRNFNFGYDHYLIPNGQMLGMF